MNKQDLIFELGNLIDFTRMGQEKWVEIQKDIYENKKHQVKVVKYGIEFKNEFTEECPEFRNTLFKLAQRYAELNNTVYKDKKPLLDENSNFLNFSSVSW